MHPNQEQTHSGSGDNTRDKYVYNFYGVGKVEIPRYLTNIPRPTDKVIGRAQQLETIRKRLAADSSLVLVNGIGGIGKTTLAMAFIEQHGNDYQHIAWVKVTDRIASAFVSSLVLIKRLHLEMDIERIPAEVREEQGFELIINTLSNLDNCLLVIDNANHADDLRACEHLLRSLRATTLLTSRAHPKSWNVYPIQQLEPQDAALLFMDHFHAAVQPAQMDTLYELLTCIDHHTLLIELLAKAATEVDLSLEELYDKVQANYIHDAELNALQVSTGAHADHTELPTEKRVANYIRMVFRQIGDLDATEQRYLRYLCLLPSDYYEKNFLMEVFQIDANTKVEFLQTMNALTVKGWLSRERNEQGKVYKLHAVIQDVAFQELGVSYELCAPVVDYWNAALYIDQTKDNPVDKFNLVQYGAYIITKLGAEQHEKISTLYDRIGWIQMALGQYQLAAFNREKALAIDLALFGAEHPNVAVRQSNLALVYQDLGQYERARDLLEAALASNLKNFGESHPNVATDYNNLIEIYAHFQQWDKAQEACDKNLAIKLQILGPDHPSTKRAEGWRDWLQKQLEQRE